jgi:hypothetical protein
MENNQGLLAKLTIKCDTKLLPSVMSFIKEIEIDFGFDEYNVDIMGFENEKKKSLFLSH